MDRKISACPQGSNQEKGETVMMPAPSQKELTSKHVRAMELSESADALRKKGQTREAVKLLAEAFCLEKNVAMAVDRYPARSILLKSAAVLACECLEFEEAYRLCGLILLEEKTPQFVRLEVLELLQDIQFEDQHLDLFRAAKRTERFKFKEPGWSKPPATFGIDLKGAEQAVLQSERVSKEQGKAQAQVIPVNGRFEIVLLDKEGKPIPHEFRKVEINGKSSETAKLRGGYPGL